MGILHQREAHLVEAVAAVVAAMVVVPPAVQDLSVKVLMAVTAAQVMVLAAVAVLALLVLREFRLGALAVRVPQTQ